MDFHAAVLHSLRAGNWQRGGGQGPQPELIERPAERPKETEPELADGDELRQRREAFNAELERRRHEPRREVTSNG